MRYVFNNSLSWSEETARFLFVWFSWIGISLGQRRGEHIRVTIVVDRFKGKAQLAVLIAADVVTLAILAVLAGYGYIAMQLIFDTGTLSSALRIPMWIVFSAMPLGCAVMGIRVVAGIVDKVRNGIQPPQGEGVSTG
jgi:TRAP-type C4-dicarboxylate transport system permease small subunit